MGRRVFMPQSRVFDPVSIDFVSGCPVLKSALWSGKSFPPILSTLEAPEPYFIGVSRLKRLTNWPENLTKTTFLMSLVNQMSTRCQLLGHFCQPSVNQNATLSARSGELTEGIVAGAHVDFASLPSKHVSSETCTLASLSAPERLGLHLNHH